MKSVSKQLIGQAGRARRRMRVRSKIVGTEKRPRISAFRSLRGMFVQAVDDSSGRTLASASAKNIDAKVNTGERKGKIADAYRIGYALAQKAKEKGVVSAVFDRNGYKYHGRIKALAEGVRDGGLKF